MLSLTRVINSLMRAGGVKKVKFSGYTACNITYCITYHCIEDHVYAMWCNLVLQTAKELNDVLWLARPWEASKLHKLLVSSPQSLHL